MRAGALKKSGSILAKPVTAHGELMAENECKA
jgi:hypothetical protein